MRQQTIEIWENGNKEEILTLKEHLRKVENGRYLIVHRKPESLDRYFRNHSEGYMFHPKRYEWDGYIYILEMIP